jgi:DNA-binding IclR family transcriptional regulator
MVFSGDPHGWFTNQQIAKDAKVNGRTARMHTLRLANLGLLEVAEVFPGNRYRLSPRADKANPAYVKRLRSAIGVFGLTEVPS